MRAIQRRLRPRYAPSARRGDTLKVVLIVGGVVFLAVLLVCGGLITAGYMWFQRNFGRVGLTDPVEIRKLTAEMVEMSIPPDFKPSFGMAMFEMKNVLFQYCPGGNCPPGQTDFSQEDNILRISNGNGANLFAFAGSPFETIDFSGADVPDEVHQEFANATVEKREFEIRGRKWPLAFVKGDRRSPEERTQLGFGDPDFGEFTTNGESEPSPERAPLKAPIPLSPEVLAHYAKARRKVVFIVGKIPGKTGDCLLKIRVDQDKYVEKQILDMLQSIR